jgi:Cysteine-rich CWC
MFEKEKQCAKCGQPFDCGGLLGCWCWSVKLDRATLASLKAQYADCLCPDCLKILQNPVTDASLTAN